MPDRDGPPLFSRLDPDNIPDAVPRMEPKSRYGNPPSYVVKGRRYYVLSTSKGYVERGLASWYGKKFHGRRTSSGKPYDMFAMTAAHRSLPLPTYVHITNLDNNRRAVVRVNDRGPFYSGRIIDLSYAAAVKLKVVGKGTAFVEIRAIDPSGGAKRAERSILPKLEESDQSIDSTPLPALHQGDLYLQVGAFTNRASAEQLKEKLHVTVYSDIRIDATQGDGPTLYKVQLGPFDDLERADQIGEELARIGLDKLQIRLDPSR